MSRRADGTGAGTPLLGHTDELSTVSWSPDGRRIATASREDLGRRHRWDRARTGARNGCTRSRRLDQRSGLVVGQPPSRDLGHRPEGRRLERGRRHARHHAPRPAGPRLEDRLVPDGRRLASVSRDRTVRLWDPETATQVAVLGVHADWANGLAWHSDGSRPATASRDRIVRIWVPQDPDLDALLHQARTRVFRAPTAEERRAYLLPAPE